MTAPDFMIEAARRRRRRSSGRPANWVTEPAAPIPWDEDSTLLRVAEQLNQPLHSRIARFGQIEAGSG